MRQTKYSQLRRLFGYLTLKMLEILLKMQLVPYAKDRAAPRYCKYSVMERIKAFVELKQVAIQKE